VEITGSPLLGEHTDEVLESLGYKSADIAKLHASGAV
jgi:formyl-CoA transferase